MPEMHLIAERTEIDWCWCNILAWNQPKIFEPLWITGKRFWITEFYLVGENIEKLKYLILKYEFTFESNIFYIDLHPYKNNSFFSLD